MTLKTQMAADLPTLYDTDAFAEDVIYTPAEDFAKTIPSLIDRGVGEGYEGADDLNMIATMTIQAQGVDGIETVTTKDSVEIEEETWKVISAKKSPDGSEWICIINRLRIPE
jgi:hypothetical protein